LTKFKSSSEGFTGFFWTSLPGENLPLVNTGFYGSLGCKVLLLVRINSALVVTLLLSIVY